MSGEMSSAHSLLLSESGLAALSTEAKKAVFVYEWLRYVRRILPAAAKKDLKAVQPQLAEQLRKLILSPPAKDGAKDGASQPPGPATRALLGQCLASLYAVADSYGLYETLNQCNDLLKSRDDSPSQLPAKLAAISAVGSCYEELGRLVGPGFDETTAILIKALRNAESQGRTEILLTFGKMVAGLGSAGTSVHKDVYKAARGCLSDRVMSVRTAAADCLRGLAKEAPWLWQTELEAVVALALKALDGSNYETRVAVARLLGQLLATAHQPPKPPPGRPGAAAAAQAKPLGLDECFSLLAVGFLRGGTGFLKGNSGVVAGLPRELRIGMTMAMVEMVKELGGAWLERSAGAWSRLVLDLASQAGKSNLGAMETVHLRRCLSFALRQTLGRLLGEKSQTNSVKDLGVLIGESMNSIDYSVEASMDRVLTPEILGSQHYLVVALLELAALVRQIGSAVSSTFTEASGILEPVFSTLLHPCGPTRLTGAWALRSVATAVPSLLTPLIDRCLSRLEHMKSSPDAVLGYSHALAALLAASQETPLGIPFAKGRQVFSVAEDLLRTASQSSRLATVKTQAGWTLLGAVMGLGPSVVKHHLPRMLLLWKNAFPRSSKEAEEERQRGDGFTWTLTLEARAGALGSMEAFFAHCGDLATDDVLRRVLGPVDACLTMLSHMPGVCRSLGRDSLRAPLTLLRRRLYAVLAALAPKYYEPCFGALLRELVAEMTLTDSAATATSLVAALCHPSARPLLGTWLADTDQRSIEEQLHPLHSAGCGALEHDAASVWRRGGLGEETLPTPVAALDAAIGVFAAVFPAVPTKHRLQMLDHFGECVKTTKAGPRQQAMQLNIFCGLLAALRSLAEQKRTLEGEAVQRAAVNLIVSSLGASSPLLRVAAAEALGRLAQAVGDPNFVAGMAQFSFDKLKSCRDVVNRTGHSLALGALHRCVGSLGSGQHLNTSVSILLALAQDASSPVVQVWAVEALGLIADTGGPMFRGYVEPTLSLCLQLLLATPAWAPDVAQCLGKLLSALITTLGPELAQNTGSIVGTRDGFLTGCALMAEHADPVVRAEGIACLQQLHLFAQRHVNLSSLVPQLVRLLQSPDLVLRKASVACLRQLVQREAREVREHAATLLPPPPAAQLKPSTEPPLLPETGLEGALFALLDTQTHPAVQNDLKEALRSLVSALAPSMLSHWLGLVKDILAATSSELLSPGGDEKVVGKEKEDKEDDEDDDDDEQLAGSSVAVGPSFSRISPRWATRVFAVEMVERMLALCETERAHLDLALAKELQLSAGKSDYLVLHLSDLIRMSFMAATSDSTQLRMAGLTALQEVITNFRRVPEPEFPGHVILEQFQAQVGAALRPAFTPETPSHLTATACQVCSTWIGSGVARDLNDLRRVHQLLVSSLAKLKRGSISTQLYSESAATLEQLAILKAWAEVYAVAQSQDSSQDETSLLSLVRPELSALISHWLASLRDNALLSLPAEFSSQLPAEGGAYYTPETADACRAHYADSWPPILLAATTWLAANHFQLPAPSSLPSDEAANSPARLLAARQTGGGAGETRAARFHLILGTCLEALCNPRQLERTDGVVDACLRTLAALLSSTWAQGFAMSDGRVPKEILNVLHRLILTRDSLMTQGLCLGVAGALLSAAEESQRRNAEGETSGEEGAWAFQGLEGGEDGQLDPETSLTYALVEVCLCQLTRQIPGVNPAVVAGKSALVGNLRKWSRLPQEAHELIATAAQLLARAPGLCSEPAKLALLPTVLFLLIGVLREASKISYTNKVPDRPPGTISKPAAVALQALKGLLASPVQASGAGSEGGWDADWSGTVQAAAQTLLHMETRPEAEAQIDEAGELLGASVFLLGVPDLVAASPALLADSTALFARCLEHPSPVVEAKALQSLQSVFAMRGSRLSAAFIRSLAPAVVGKFREGETPLDEGRVAVLAEAIKAVEVLCSVAVEERRLPLVSLLVQFLASQLGGSTSRAERRLEEVCLARLEALGPQYPAELKAVFASFPEMKPKLEAALAAKSGRTEQTRLGQANGAPEEAKKEQPAIKLTMDFSAFKAPA